MKFSGVYWLAIQDIGGFTNLSEEFAKRGKKGTEELRQIVGKFFQEAESKILNLRGRIFKLAGDAYYAILPACINTKRMEILGNDLLNLKSLKKYNLRTRFIAVQGKVEAEWIPLSEGYNDLLIRGQTIYDLDLLEEKTPAGKIAVFGSNKFKIFRMPEFPATKRVIHYGAAHRPLYIAFLEIPQDFTLVHKITDFFQTYKENIKLMKWIPLKNKFKALVIAGFPESTGREAQICLETFFKLRKDFENFEFRMGICSGIVFAGGVRTKRFQEFAILGDRVNVAARLCAAASSNDVYISEEVQKLLIGKFNFADIGAIKLKGKEERIRAYKPQEKVLDIFSPQLFAHPFIGREKEISMAMNLAKNRKGFCIIGDAGVGKSRMLYEIKKKRVQKNIIEIGLPPLSPPLYFLKEIFKYFPEGDFPEIKNYFEGSIQLPAIRVVKLLNDLFKTKNNLTIFAEDIHWIDEASLFLLKELTPLPFQLIASSRPEGENIADNLKLEKIYLKNLSPSSLKILFETIHGAQPDKKLLDFLIKHSEGNPFYFEQILIDLQEKNFIKKVGNRFSISEDTRSLPFSIHSILLSRYESLPPEAKKPTEIAACIGFEFSPETVKKALDVPCVNFESTCTKGIVIKVGPLYQFKHALFREAILNSILEIKRRTYERKIAQVFIKEDRTAFEIAHHLTEGGDAYQALPYWSATFDELYSRGFHNEITNIIQRLNDYEDENIKKISSFINASYLIKMSDYYDAEKILLQLKKNSKIKKYILLELADLYDWSSQYSKMAQVLKILKNHKMNIDEKLVYLEECGIYYDMVGKNSKALDYYKKTFMISQKFHRREALIASLYNIGWIYFKEKKYQKAEIYFRKFLTLVKEGDLLGEGVALLRLGQIEMLKGNLSIAQSYLKRSHKNFQILGFVYWERISLRALSELYILLGRKKKALWFAREADKTELMLNIEPNYSILLHLYYGELALVEKALKGKEDKYVKEYFLYLLAQGKKQSAMDFLRRHNLISIIPSKKELRKKTFPLNFISLYRKYTHG